MDKLKKRTKSSKFKEKFRRKVSLSDLQRTYSKQPSGRLVFYVMWFCLTYILLLNCISDIEWLNILYPLTLLSALFKDLFIDRKLIAASGSRFIWFEHSGILLAFITFAIASGLYRIPLIGITSVFMGTDLLIDLMQDIGILNSKRKHRLKKGQISKKSKSRRED